MITTKLLKTSCILLLAFVIVSCSSKNRPKEVSDEVVLKIGKFELTKYEFELKYDQFKNSKKFKGEKDKENWMNEFIDKCYFLADAYDKNYDTLKTIQKSTDYAALFMASNVGEYYWNKIVEPTLEVSSSDIKAIYKKMDKIFYLDYLVFSDKQVMISRLNADTIIKTETEFNKIASVSKDLRNVWYGTHAFIWPFEHLEEFKDIIYELKPGNVTKPLRGSKWIYIIHLNKIETIKPKPYKNEKTTIENGLRQMKANLAAEKKQNEIFERSHLKTNEIVAKELLKYFKDSTRIVNVDFGNKILVSYLLNKKRTNLTIADFLDYYNNFPFGVNPVEDINSIFSTVNILVIMKSLFAEADSLGVTREKGFQLEKRSYANSFISRNYFSKEIAKNVVITDAEQKDYYEKNRSLFETEKVCNAYLFYFKDKQSLQNSWAYLDSKFSTKNFENLTDTAKVVGLTEYLPNQRIEVDSKGYPLGLISAIFNSTLNQISPPYMEFQGEYVIFCKTKVEGKRIQAYEDAKNSIFDKLMKNKIEQAKNKKVEELKKKYIISINKTKSLI